MHALIINGSPRVKKYSNTDKILLKITAGMEESGATYEQYEVSDRSQWPKIRERFYLCDHILIALPLYVECIPGLLIEFLETLDAERKAAALENSAKRPVMSFLLQSGFAEGVQLRCGEAYLEMLADRLGCEYGGTLVKGDNFSIRLFEGEQREKITGAYQAMGKIYGRDGAFRDEACRKFTGPEVFPLPVRLLVGTIFKTLAKKGFKDKAKEWGCTRPLDDKPYLQ
ncbi:MAG: NAD(P)H-dependent oxidoreductase [Clostridiales bacterium]|nr:NAD(P)H-dependent oxidoreductase [Clostridiales bacterium]